MPPSRIKHLTLKTLLVFLALFTLALTACGNKQDDTQSSDKQILSFLLTTEHNPELNRNIECTIAGTDIEAVMPYGASLNHLVADFSTSGTLVTVNEATQESGVTENDFGDTLIYKVTAQDGSTQEYRVTLELPLAPSSEKNLTAFAINNVPGVISGTTISISLEAGTSPMGLVATFTTTGDAVTINDVTQFSGTTANDFSSPLTYTVTAEDGTSQNYTVTVTISTDQTVTRIANHSIVNRVRLDQIPESAILQAQSNLKIAYGHTSHGSQITDGMSGLVAFKNVPGLYTFNSNGSDGAMEFHDYYGNFGGSDTDTTASDLGNPNRTAWAQATREYLNANPDINVIIWSWCGQATTSIENIDIYLNLMEDLIEDYPTVQFVFMTGHLRENGSTDLIADANNHIRSHCTSHNRWLFDFADIESYNPDGEYFGDKKATDACTYVNAAGASVNWAINWQDTHPGLWYQCGSAHSQPLNANQKAYAAWWLWARMAGWDGTIE